MAALRESSLVRLFEQGIDSCDHVGHVLEGIVVKHAALS